MVKKGWLGAAPAAALACIALSGCLGSGDSSTPPANAGRLLGMPVRLADCDDWRRSSYRDRLEAVKEVRAFAGGPVGTDGRHGATLDDFEAYRVLDDTCKNGYAKYFKLYKLYTRAAAFRKQ